MTANDAETLIQALQQQPQRHRLLAVGEEPTSRYDLKGGQTQNVEELAALAYRADHEAFINEGFNLDPTLPNERNNHPPALNRLTEAVRLGAERARFRR